MLRKEGLHYPQTSTISITSPFLQADNKPIVFSSTMVKFMIVDRFFSVSFPIQYVYASHLYQLLPINTVDQYNKYNKHVTLVQSSDQVSMTK